MARKRKSSTPDWVDELLNFREEIGEEEYREYWKRLNRVRDNTKEWDELGKEIIREIEGEKLVFRARDFKSLADARRAAEIAQSDFGGRIVRRSASGKFSKRGKTFQVIGARIEE